ncbi:FAD-dependent oxidoreductase [Lentilactobacillus senioris]|uniref:NAD(P)/FAD-dependent oxidoreductase n=1 Tax=Lentilactobacillus senioris TaxID=931534 RepID=UPI0022806F4B|nr:FAD-dependent oxidoreductase [Lentilactobacillus senioris]MCY9806158.1 FAD-dependent oxidoreductase [Lentilactobacillus senioris]
MENTKVVIVGASHGGHESAIELLQKYSNVDVTIYEAGDFVSFMSCGMELFLEDQVTSQDDVRNFKPDDIIKMGGNIYNNHEVTAIDADKKQVTVKNVIDGTSEAVDYDKLILSSGVTPRSLSLPGNDLANIYEMRGYDWATKIKAAMNNDAIQNVVVIGSGYIGIEATEAFTKAGKQVTLLDSMDRPLATYLDPEMTKYIEKELEANGVKLGMGVNITSYQGENGTVTAVEADGKQFPADLVICATGVIPNTDWLKGTLNLDQRGFIETDPYLRTNLPDVYAIGDALKPYNIPANQQMPIALATTARREAQYVVDHLFENQAAVPFAGVVGSSALSVFNLKFAATGLNSMTAKRANVNAQTNFYQDYLRPAYVPVKNGNLPVYVTITYNPLNHQILGGSVMSPYDVTAQGNVLALATSKKLTLEDLASADFFFQPGFDRQWSLLNLAAQSALGWQRF